MNILITGGTGFIATHLIKRLMRNDRVEKIYVVARRVDSFIEDISSYKNVCIIMLSLDEYLSYFEVFNHHIDVLFHFTWQGIRGADRHNEELQKQNYEYSQAFIKELIKKNNGMMVFLSGSQSEYGKVENIIPISEEMILPVTEIEPYGKYKKRLYDDLNEFLRDDSQTRLYNCRYISLYGMGDYNKSLVSIAIHALSQENVLCLSSDCKNLWNYLYIEDAVEALEQMMKVGPSSGIYNFCSDETKPLKDFVEDMRTVLNSRTEIIYGTLKSNTNLNYSNKKLKSAIGWKPKYSFADGIKDMISKGEIK